MKHTNKTIFATTLLTSLFLVQPVLANEEIIHGEYSGHAATSLQSEITAPKMKHMHNGQVAEHADPSIKVSYQLNQVASLQQMVLSGKK